MPAHFTAVGSVIDRNGQPLNISGWVNFDDQLRYWGSSELVPLDANGYWQTKYPITGYSLQVGNYAFSGAQGSLYMELDLNPGATSTGDFMWFLEGGTGAWNKWTGEEFHFLNEDGSYKERNATTYRTLADSILLKALDYNSEDAILPEYSSDFILTLTRQVIVPNPPHALRILGVSSS